MKIMHITDSLRSGGKERQLVEVLKYFSKKAYVTSEVIIMSNDIHYDYIADLDIKIYKIIRAYNKDLSIFFKLFRIFKIAKPDIIHSWNSMCSVYAVLSAKLLGIKFVENSLQDAPLRFDFKNESWLRSKLTFPLSNIIASNSYAGLESYKVPMLKRVCLHNGFDFKRLNGLESNESMRIQLNIKTDYIVGMVASFSPYKDYVTFVKTAHLILEKRRDVTFIAVGDGELFENIKAMIKSEYTDYIKLLGQQKRVLNIVNIFNVGILTTFTEGISNSVMEYMALKKPVITTDCAGSRELVENNHTGFLVAPQNHVQIEKYLLLLLNNESLSRNLGENGFRKLKSDFNLEKMGANFSLLYSRIIKS